MSDPEAMAKFIDYLTRTWHRPGKHHAGHAGQKAKAKAKRRGTYGKAVRRRQLAARRAEIDARTRQVSQVVYDETGPE